MTGGSSLALVPAGGLLGFQRPTVALVAVGLGCGVVVGAGAGLGPAPALGALAVCLGGVVLLVRPDVGLLVLAGLVPVVAGLRRGLPLPGARLSEVVTVGVAAIVLLRLDRRTSPPWRSFDWLVLTYATGHAGIGAANVLSRDESFTATSLGTLVGPFQFLLLYRAALALLGEEGRRRLVLRLMLIASVPVCVLALAQAAEVPGVGEIVTFLTGNDIGAIAATEARDFQRAESTLRATGPFPHWQVLAGYLFVIGLLALTLSLEPAQRVLGPRWLLGILVLVLAAMLATGTFATTLSLVAAAVAVGAWARRLPRVAGLLGGVALIPAVAFSGTVSSRIDQQFGAAAGAGTPLLPQSLAYRVDLWRDEYLPELAGRWLFGYGPDLPPGVGFRFTESVYLTLLLRGGVVLLVLFAAVMAALAACAWSLRDHPQAETRVVGRVLVVLLGALLVLHLVEPYLLTSGLPQLFWLLAAVAMALGTTRPAARRRA